MFPAGARGARGAVGCFWARMHSYNRAHTGGVHTNTAQPGSGGPRAYPFSQPQTPNPQSCPSCPPTTAGRSRPTTSRRSAATSTARCAATRGLCLALGPPLPQPPVPVHAPRTRQPRAPCAPHPSFARFDTHRLFWTGGSAPAQGNGFSERVMVIYDGLRELLGFSGQRGHRGSGV